MPSAAILQQHGLLMMTEMSSPQSSAAAFRGDNNFKLIKADMLRRSGEFDRVVREFQDTAYPSLLMTAINFFEVHLASAEDKGIHTINEIPGISAAEK